MGNSKSLGTPSPLRLRLDQRRYRRAWWFKGDEVMKIKHAVLKNLNGNESLTTWLDVRPGLKAGAIVTLKDFRPEERWVVEQLFEQEHDATDFDFHRGWDNNNYDQHKGLGV